MISRRLTKTQKTEIVEAYRAGENATSLAERYGCTPNTVNRTVKTILSDDEYILLKGKRSRISNKKENKPSKKTVSKIQEDVEDQSSYNTFKSKFNNIEKSLKIDSEFYKSEINKNQSIALKDADDFGEEPSSYLNNGNDNLDKLSETFDDNFEVIAPLVSDFDFDVEKQKLDFEIDNYETLPDSVYMLVDKKVELDSQKISDLPEWSFLPENELERYAILLFSNQRSAKRSCSRTQRVIKIPNTNVFKVSKSYLVSKGITRLILEDSLIALDD